jgi:hypothetical protein
VVPPVWLPAVALLLAGAGCGGEDGREARAGVNPSARPAPAGSVLDLDFEQSYVAPGAVVASAENGTPVPVRTTISTSAGGRITRTEGADSSSALRFPRYTARTTPAAVLLLWETDGEDRLSPGDRSFSFGADFSLDAVSSGSPADNGDNLVQRGLSTDAVQYKIQIDRGIASCRIAGTAGEAVLEAKAEVLRGTWYRVECRRRGSSLTLVLEQLGRSGPGSRAKVTATAPTGTVEVAAAVPLAIGGKVAADGTVTASSTDQFNGVIDNVRFALLN